MILKKVIKEEKAKNKSENFKNFQNKKPKVAIVSLTSCEGCQFALLDLGQKFLDFSESVDMVEFRLIEDEEDDGQKLDLVLIEGNPITKANEKTLF